MDFIKHYGFEDKHAFLGPSRHHWVNYDDEKFDFAYRNNLAARKGTELHAIAAALISNGIKLPDNTKTLNRYVNDAIGFRMSPEVVLFYSQNCFGTVDAISFKDNFLRVHDLKTGVSPTYMRQLEIYTALFCLEYKKSPNDFEYELRIYKNDSVEIHVPEPEAILYIIEKILKFDKRVEELNREEL